MILSYNLQFFAKDGPGGEKTEPATSKKLNDARKEGQVAKSQELGNGFSLLVLFILLKLWIGSLGENFLSLFQLFYSYIPTTVTFYTGEISQKTLHAVLFAMLSRILIMALPFFLIGAIVVFIVDLLQVKWAPTWQPLHPKMSKMNPVSGIKRIFSVRSLMELLKSAAKIGIIGYLVINTLKKKMGLIFLLYDISLQEAIVLLGDTIISLGIKIAGFYMIIAFADYAFQKWKFSEDMKMTKQEVKDEYKNAEGDPQVKGKIRQKMREASQRRMMQALPKADVVITNPTHYAVAIQYDPDQYAAPVVVAKGEDYLAQKIKEKAKEYKIEIVENKPLARMLYANVEVGELIPPELYQAVAEVLAMVYHMQGRV